FRRRTNTFVNPGFFILRGGTFFAGAGTNDLGILLVEDSIAGSVPATIDLETVPVGSPEGGGPSVLRFRDSHNFSWGTPELLIKNWAGSATGGGADRIYVGTSAAGLTSQHLAHIQFVNPAGFPSQSGITTAYPAKILATGEIVPSDTRPALGYARSANNLT